MNNSKNLYRDCFNARARDISSKPSLIEHCYISGRDPRIWANPEILEDLSQNLVDLLTIDSTSTILEVGCASGFIAQLLVNQVKHYTGIDIAEKPIKLARQLLLNNAAFDVGDAGKLPYRDNSFDSALCYDVFTNFPDFSTGAPIIKEMYRVTKPNGKILIGSIPNQECREEYERCIKETQKELDKTYGPPEEIQKKQSFYTKLASLLTRNKQSNLRSISCYYFRKKDFYELAQQLNCEIEITTLHSKNPYYKLRFNVILTKKYHENFTLQRD